jgi:hypothetical protein
VSLSAAKLGNDFSLPLFRDVDVLCLAASKERFHLARHILGAANPTAPENVRRDRLVAVQHDHN